MPNTNPTDEELRAAGAVRLVVPGTDFSIVLTVPGCRQEGEPIRVELASMATSEIVAWCHRVTAVGKMEQRPG